MQTPCLIVPLSLALSPFVQRGTSVLWCFVSSSSGFMHLGPDSCYKTLMKCFQLGGTSERQERVMREQQAPGTCGSLGFKVMLRISDCAPELSLQACLALYWCNEKSSKTLASLVECALCWWDWRSVLMAQTSQDCCHLFSCSGSEGCRVSPGSGKPLRNTNNLIKAASCLTSVVASVEQRAGTKPLNSTRAVAPLGEKRMQTWDNERILLIL